VNERPPGTSGSASDPSGRRDILARGAFRLGALKSNVGYQNYRIPDGLDLARVRTAVVWCRRFKVGFAVATVEAGA
jgi:electron transfer DM13